MGYIRNCGGEDKLEEEHEVLEDNDEDDGLGAGDVGEDTVDGAGEAYKAAVDDDSDEAHHL